MWSEGETVMVSICALSLMFILINFLMMGRVNITYMLGVDIAVWIVFHLILDVILHKKGTAVEEL